MWILEILLCWGIAALLGYGIGKLIKADRDIAAAEGREPVFPERKKEKEHWTVDIADPEEEQPKRHWTEFLDNSSEANDRNDDWEWDRQDDFGDSWDHKDSWGG